MKNMTKVSPKSLMQPPKSPMRYQALVPIPSCTTMSSFIKNQALPTPTPIPQKHSSLSIQRLKSSQYNLNKFSGQTQNNGFSKNLSEINIAIKDQEYD